MKHLMTGLVPLALGRQGRPRRAVLLEGGDLEEDERRDGTACGVCGRGGLVEVEIWPERIDPRVRIVPAGTHDPRKFIQPNELRAEFMHAGILLDDMTGFAPHPGGGFMPTGSLAVNYAASGGFR